MSRTLAAIFLLLPGFALASPAPLVCPAGTPIGSVDLRVRPARGGNPLPLRTINRLEEGDAILYRPVLRASEIRKGQVAIVLVPAVRGGDHEKLLVLDPRPAAQGAEWKVPARSTVAAFVYGPSGLSRGKVERFLAKDEDLVSQLADYAEKTAQTEALIAALSSDTSSAASVDAAFRGFASHYGGAAQIDRTAPADQQLMLAMRTLNPAMSTYDPIAPQGGQAIGQTASLATAVASLFFGSPIGLAAGGTAMLMEMRSMAFPNTVFRSSFAQNMQDDALGLCGKRDAVPSHTKVAFLWATRIPNIGPPHISIGKELDVASGMKMAVPVNAPSDVEWKAVDRARSWTLSNGHDEIPLDVHPLGEPKALELDLTKAKLKPGTYHLAAHWDWDSFTVAGDVPVAEIGGFEKARVTGESQDRLVVKSGRVPVILEGGDFEFVTKVEIEKPGDRFFTPAPVPFVLPRGFREGPQTRLDVQLNTNDLDAGDYRLQITQADGKARPAPVAILPEPPKVANLPVMVNQGDATREITLKGERLDRIAKIEMPGADLTLGPANGDGTERKLSLRFEHGAQKGACLEMKAWIENRREPLLFERAVEIGAPRPRVLDSRLSLPPGLPVAMNPGELPAAYSLSALLRVEGLRTDSVVNLECDGDATPRAQWRTGVSSAGGSAQQLGPGQLFLTFDTGVFPNACQLVASVENGAGGRPSDPYGLGRVVRIPRIESLQMASDTEAVLTGRDLETIESVGWDPEHGKNVSDLPVPVPGEGQKQELRVALPSAQPADASLYVWLRGEAVGRASFGKLTAAAANR